MLAEGAGAHIAHTPNLVVEMIGRILRPLVSSPAVDGIFNLPTMHAE